MVYIATFLCSALFGYWATRINPKTNRGLVILCSLISVLIPSILAGLRHETMGEDILYYLKPLFYTAERARTFQDYLLLRSDIEDGFELLVFVVAKQFGNIQWLLFFIELIMMTCIYIGAWKFRKQISLPLVLLLYFFLYYSESYNLMRQNIAMTIVFAGIWWLCEKKYIWFCLFVFLAMQIHTTAILGLVMLVIHFFLESDYLKKTEKSKTFRSYFLILCVFLLLIFFAQLARVLVEIGFLDAKYLLYLDKDSTGDSLLNNILFIIQIVFVLLFSKSLEDKVQNYPFFKTNLFFSFALLQLSRVIWAGHRMSFYFGIVNILFVAMLPNYSEKTANKRIVTAIMLFLYMMYWIYCYCLNNEIGTYPYIPYWEN